LRIQREKPAVVIDAGECWNDRGHKTLERSLADNVAYSKGKVTGNIAAAANQGRRMADIGRSPDTRLLIAQIAGEKSARPMELRFARVPDSRPRIQVTGYLDMNWTGGDIQFDISRHQVTARHERRQLNIYLQTQPRLYIQIIDIRA
jgi:hypothetical protein